MNDDLDTIDQLNEAFSNVTYDRDVTEFVTTPPRARHRHRKVGVVIAITATAALATGGLAAARRGLPEPTSYAIAERSDQQAAALNDDTVTFEEYQAGFRRFADCMERDGRPISVVELDPTTQLYSWGYDGIDDCYERELYALDVTWQLDPNRPGFVRQPSAGELLDQACEQGGPVPGFPFEGEQLAQLCDRRDQTRATGG